MDTNYTSIRMRLVTFGDTHVCAVYGYSGKIVGFVTIQVKNNVEIYVHLFRLQLHTLLLCNYSNIYRCLVLKHRLWNKVRVCHSKELTGAFCQLTWEGTPVYHHTYKPHQNRHDVKLCADVFRHSTNSVRLKSCICISESSR